MSLVLSKEDQEEYDRRSKTIEIQKQVAIAAKDQVAAKKARQAQSHLYNEFQSRQIRVDRRPADKYDIENSMSIEERLDRIERHLKIGRYADNF